MLYLHAANEEIANPDMNRIVVISVSTLQCICGLNSGLMLHIFKNFKEPEKLVFILSKNENGWYNIADVYKQKY